MRGTDVPSSSLSVSPSLSTQPLSVQGTSPVQPAALRSEPSERTVNASCSAMQGRPLSKLEVGILEVITTLQGYPNVTVWPVGGTLIHLLRHGRFSDFAEHDQEFDLDLAVTSPGNDSAPQPEATAQWIVDTLANIGVLRQHVLKKKKSAPGTGTCRKWSKGQHIACKHVSLGLHFDFFLGGVPSGGLSSEEYGKKVQYAPLGVQPYSLIHPMKRCKAWNTWIHCPNDPYQVLKVWGVETGYEVKEGCLLFPRHMQKFVREKGAPVEKAVEYKKEAADLVAKAAGLEACGFAGFNVQVRGETDCIKDIKFFQEI